jgi:hypothetical protein
MSAMPSAVQNQAARAFARLDRGLEILGMVASCAKPRAEAIIGQNTQALGRNLSRRLMISKESA